MYFNKFEKFCWSLSWINMWLWKVWVFLKLLTDTKKLWNLNYISTFLSSVFEEAKHKAIPWRCMGPRCRLVLTPVCDSGLSNAWGMLMSPRNGNTECATDLTKYTNISCMNILYQDTLCPPSSSVSWPIFFYKDIIDIEIAEQVLRQLMVHLAELYLLLIISE